MGQVVKAHETGDTGGTTRLADLLHRLAQTGPDVMAGEPGVMNLRLMLREIDETVLPRELSVFDGQRLLARLKVSNRRLVDLIVVGDDAQDRDLEPDAAERVFARQLAELAGRGKHLQVRVTARAPEFGQTGISCSAARLATAAGLDASQGLDLCALDAFQDRLTPQAGAWIRVGSSPGEVCSGGDRVAVARLQALHARGFASASPMQVARNQPGCTLLPLPGNLNLVVAVDGRRRLLALIPASRATAVTSDWSAIYRG